MSQKDGFQLTGKLYSRDKTENKGSTEKPFDVRNFSIAITNERNDWVNLVPFQLQQDRCGLISGYKKDEVITVHFDISGREWNEKIFCNNVVWKITDSDGSIRNVAGKQETPPPPQPKEEPPADDDDDDLPF